MASLQTTVEKPPILIHVVTTTSLFGDRNSIPKDLLMAKERLRFDSEKLGFVDVTQENVDGSDLGRSPLDGCEDPPAVFAPPQGDGAVPSEPPLLPREAAAGEPPSDVEGYSPDRRA